MKRKQHMMVAVGSAISMVFLILEPGIAFQAATEGIELCLRTVIPSLFPFMVLSAVVTESTHGLIFPGLRWVSRLCGVPSGKEAILIVGFLGGYPVGANSIASLWKMGQLSQQDAHRMLGFCSNAGPAFILGMTAALFREPLVPWALWGIQILSAIAVGMLLPGAPSSQSVSDATIHRKQADLIRSSVSAMGSICAWVVLFRILNSYCAIWLMKCLSVPLQFLIPGFLELTNGCLLSERIQEPALRFVFCGVILSFGGLCVGMQTATTVGELGMGLYFPGKIMQCLIAGFLSCMVSPLLFPGCTSPIPWWIPAAMASVVILLRKFLKIRGNYSSNLALQRV